MKDFHNSKYYWLILWRAQNKRKYHKRLVERRRIVRECFGVAPGGV